MYVWGVKHRSNDGGQGSSARANVDQAQLRRAESRSKLPKKKLVAPQPELCYLRKRFVRDSYISMWPEPPERFQRPRRREEALQRTELPRHVRGDQCFFRFFLDCVRFDRVEVLGSREGLDGVPEGVARRRFIEHNRDRRFRKVHHDVCTIDSGDRRHQTY